MKGSRIENNKRYCYLDNGDTLEESFLASNAENTFIYTIHEQASFPADNIVGIIHLQANKPIGTSIFWSVEMDISSDDVFEELQQSIEHMYSEAIRNLNKLASDTRTKVTF